MNEEFQGRRRDQGEYRKYLFFGLTSMTVTLTVPKTRIGVTLVFSGLRRPWRSEVVPLELRHVYGSSAQTGLPFHCGVSVPARWRSDHGARQRRRASRAGPGPPARLARAITGMDSVAGPGRDHRRHGDSVPKRRAQAPVNWQPTCQGTRTVTRRSPGRRRRVRVTGPAAVPRWPGPTVA